MQSNSKSFSFVAVANTKTYNKGGAEASLDVNGNYPIQLSIIAGKCPIRALVMSGSIAISNNIESGNTYVIQASYRDTNEYGDNWNHQVLGKLSAVDLAKLPEFIKSFGTPTVVEYTEKVDTKVNVEAVAGE